MSFLGPDAHSPPPPGWAIFVTCALFGIIVAAIPMTLRIYGDRRATRLLDEWVKRSGHQLLSKRIVSYGRGPFAMRGYWTTVFVITAKLSSGEEKSGWLCTNNFFIWGGKVPDVRWDG